MEFCHNQRLHSTTKQTLFHLMMEYEPKDIPLGFKKMNVPAVEQRLKILKEVQNKASTAHELTKQRVAQQSTQE